MHILLIILIIVFVYFNFIKGKEKDPLKKIWDKKKEKELAEGDNPEDGSTEEGNAQETVVKEEQVTQCVQEQQVQTPVQNSQPGPMNTIDLFSHVGTNSPNNNDINKMG